MKIAIYSTKEYEKNQFEQIKSQHTFCYITESLSLKTIGKSFGCNALCCFVTDTLNTDIIYELAKNGIKLIALRSAGFDHVDLKAANQVGITVVRVPIYSPEAVAEFAVGLILALSRKILKAYMQGLNYNFSLEGLMGFNLANKTVGIIGTGHIGCSFAKIMYGFGCQLLAVDPFPKVDCRQLNLQYVTLNQLLNQSDIISLHCPLNEATKYIINENTLKKIKKGALLINTGRGALCDTQALIKSLESGQLGGAGLDVYEKEKGLFFIDHHGKTIDDPLFLKLQSLPNVIITPHQAFLSQEAVINIIKITIDNITAFELGNPLNQIEEP